MLPPAGHILDIIVQYKNYLGLLLALQLMTYISPSFKKGIVTTATPWESIIYELEAI